MRINADSVRSDAKKLLQAAEACRVNADVCRNCQNELSLYWEGEAANAYMNSLAQLNRKSQTLEQQIQQLSSQIIWVANEIEEEDRRIAAENARRAAAQAQANAQAQAQAQAAAAAAKQAAQAAANRAAAQAQAQAAVQKAADSSIGQLAQTLINGLLGRR